MAWHGAWRGVENDAQWPQHCERKRGLVLTRSLLLLLSRSSLTGVLATTRARHRTERALLPMR